MKRKELFVVIYVSLGEVPDNKTLRESGITLQDYVNELTTGIRVDIPEMKEFDIEIDEVKAKVKTFEDGD